MSELPTLVRERVPEGFAVLDSEWCYTYVNEQAGRLIGMEPAELVGRNIWSLFPDLVEHPFRSACERAMRELEPLVVEGVFDATGRVLECRIFPAPFGLTLVFGDVTEPRAAEARLREVEEQFRQLTENVQEIFWLVSVPDRDVIYVSPNYTAIWGDAPPGVVCDPFEAARTIHASDHTRLIDSFMRAQRGQDAVAEYRIVRPGQDDRWMRTRFFPVRDEGGTVHRVAGTTEDVSDKKVLEAQLLQAQKMEAIGRLAGGIAHDFNNHLTAILGFSRLLEDEIDPDSELAEFIGEILTAAERSAKLTNKLLAFSRRQIMQPQLIDLGSVVAGVELMMRRIIEKNIELVTVPGTTNAKVKADPTQMEQVLVNLVLNARDAMPNGGRILVQVLSRHMEEPTRRSHGVIPAGDYVVLAVSDHGCGMDEATVARIFEPFFTTKPPHKGTGLGLAMVLGIVQQSGGHIAVFTRPEGGTTVKVYLPAIEERVPDAPRPEPENGSAGKATVLLVDDEPSVRKLSRATLRRAGYSVLEAENGEEGLRAWNEHKGRIDLVLTDLTMPVMGGKELGRRISSDPDAVPVLYMSGYSKELETGPDPTLTTRFLKKPFAPAELILKVEGELGEKF